MADLAFNPNHNVCALLEATHRNASDFLEAMLFLKESTLMTALTANPVVYSSLIEDFWGNAQVVEDNGNFSIHSLVQGSSIVVNEEVIRRVLLLNDELGLNFLEMDEVHEIFRRLGYQGDFIKTMVKKANVSYNWRYLIHVFIHCLSEERVDLIR